MRFRSFGRNVLMLLAAACPMALHAQFQPVNEEELKMTADPKAPGAAAVYLAVEDVTDDSLHSRIYYARIKILAEQGKELAAVEVPVEGTGNSDKEFATAQVPYQGVFVGYSPDAAGGSRRISDFKARTIHPDGSITPLEGKFEDLLVRQTTPEGVRRAIVNLPAVTVGSVLEYRFVERYDGLYSSPLWQVQRNYFVHKAHFTFLPYKTFLNGSENLAGSYLVDRHGSPLNFLLYWPKLPAGVELKRDGPGRFFLDVTDIPAAPKEEWVPPNDSLLYRVRFYYKGQSSAKDFWEAEGKRWSKEVDQRAEPTKAIHEAVAGIVAHGDSEREKARKLYKAVQALENTDFIRKTDGSKAPAAAAKRAEETWTSKSGSSQDIALLYLAMLRAAGITAYDMKVVNRDRSVFAHDYLYFDQLDDDIILAKIDGKEIVLDPGQKMCPFETVHWKHSGAGGIRESPDGHYAVTSPQQPLTGNTLVRLGEINVDEKGTIQGSFRFTMAGQEALRWRQEALLSSETDVKKDFDRQLSEIVPTGVEASLDRFEGLTDPDVNLAAIITVKGSLGTRSTQGIQLPSFFFETRAHQPFVGESRRLDPVDMHYGDQVTDQVTYHLPNGVTVAGAPVDGKFAWEAHSVFAVKTQSSAGQITIARSLARAFTFAKPEDFDSLRDFYQKVDAADQQPVVLAIGSPTSVTGAE